MPRPALEVRIRERPIFAPRAHLSLNETAAILGTSHDEIRAAVHAGELRRLEIDASDAIDAESAAALVRSRSGHVALALWTIEQILLGKFDAPSAEGHERHDETLMWAMNHLISGP